MNFIKNQKGYTDIVIISLILGFIGALFITGVFIQRQISNTNNLTKLINKLAQEIPTKKEVTIQADPLDEDWVVYQHPVLGLEFTYKKEWGDPITAPVKSITDLETVNKKYTGSNPYVHSLSISFSNSIGPSIQIFDNQYVGELYPNGRAYQYGPIDNFTELKQSENICDYKIDFPNNPSNTGIIVEDYSECNNNIKTVLLKDTKNFTYQNIGTKYSYKLLYYGFKKLANGYFDNLLATLYVASTNQLDNDDISYANFLDQPLFVRGAIEAKPIPKEKYEQDKQDFAKFVNSLKTFEPAETDIRLNEILDTNNAVIKLIKKYYNHILLGELSEAYSMYEQADIDFEQYQDWYKDTIMANTRDFTLLDDNTYRFFVDYQDHNKNPQVYRVTMKVMGENINIVSSEEIVGKIIETNNMKAFVKIFRDYNYVILEKNGQEIEVDSAPIGEDASLGARLSFSVSSFSPDGRYLAYKAGGWEWSFGRLYDTKNKNQVLDLSAMHNYGFTDNSEYFYACSLSHMGGEQYVNIYNVPNFDTPVTADDLGIFESTGFMNDFLNTLYCSINSSNNLEIIISGYKDNRDTTSLFENVYEYNFKTKEIIKK